VPIRSAAFAISLVALFWYAASPSRPRYHHPAQNWLILCLVYLGLMIFHPATNSLVTGIAQVMLYLSVMAPVFWGPRLKCTSEQVQRVLLLLLICSGVNSLVGILQVYDPGSWLPKEFSTVVMHSDSGIDAGTYIGPSGNLIVRPPGLFDAPGAISGPAAMATILGLIFFFGPVNFGQKTIGLVAAISGIAAIFLSHVRTSLVVAAGSLLAYGAILTFQRKKTRALVLWAVAALAAVGSFSLAMVLGGESVQERFSTLLEDDPVTLYYSVRGVQLEYGLKTLFLEYPFGAGLGRWGMMRQYFGNENNLSSPPIWAELQPNAWILDGGWVLLLFYPFALAATTRSQLRAAKFAPSASLRFAAAAILALSVAVLFLVFGYTPFTAQVGMQYWFLAGILRAAVAREIGSSSRSPATAACYRGLK